ncbi:hypothetical protein GCL60_16295 [Silvanigrella paludirubra]|uniref:Uncharacterized protein n=1 Tax=Silvanigrella paludirubra TaxID=2499159 RepID=A0A6N6VMQ9_9BACT|nr:hypothetical protein [Silvanigrella paludirubra]KAB8035788.1 hypothetical protein GCL60_16295 [Silvanigrella paludirubra]
MTNLNYSAFDLNRHEELFNIINAHDAWREMIDDGLNKTPEQIFNESVSILYECLPYYDQLSNESEEEFEARKEGMPDKLKKLIEEFCFDMKKQKEEMN